MDNRPKSRNARSIVALIATRGRTDLLLQRAVPSILRQARLPDRLLVVVDQSKSELPNSELKKLTAAIQSQCGDRVPATVLRNRRTQRRAAGAWNSGIDQLHRDSKIMSHPDLWFVAILDDDDAWAPEHLEVCIEEAIGSDSNMVVAGLIRHESPDDQGRLQSIPMALNARDQFIRGQHIQGSNLLVRLDQMLMVGGFDEHLPSCTDRDLCIRLAGLSGIRVGYVQRHTVHHFADSRADRLSSPASPSKLDGLTRFWRKHADRFDAAAQAEASKRAIDLFGWTLPTPTPVVLDIPALVPVSKSMSVVVGFVTDAIVPTHVPRLLEDLMNLASQSHSTKVSVVVVENGPMPTDGQRPLRDLVADFHLRGLEVELISLEKQREDWEQGRLIDTPDPTRQRLRIAVSRTVLNTYVAQAAARRPGSIAWILDDDKRLSVQIDRGDGSIVTRSSPDLATICALQDTGTDIVIGPDTDAAPLPFAATLRVQLIDLEHTLAVLANLSPSDPWPNRSNDNSISRASMQDSYYDLSKHTEHLETPFSLVASNSSYSAADILAFVAGKVERLLAGEAVFRPLSVSPCSLDKGAAIDSVQRGGSTFFLKPQHLLEYPQSIARFGDRFVRRSDMLVSQLMRDQLGLKIVMHGAAGVRHDRSCTTRAQLDDLTLWEDVLGYALYRSANELMQQRSVEQRKTPLLAWTHLELKEAVRKVRKYINERLAAFTLNAWRTFGLADSIRFKVLAMKSCTTGWSEEASKVHFSRIAKEMDRICSQFKPTAVAMFADGIRKSITDSDISNTFASMDGLISEYRSTQPIPAAADLAKSAAREDRARALLKRAYGVKSLRLLGAGGEGVVLTDDVRVYKVFDLLKRRPNHDTLETLIELSNRTEQPRYLYPLARVEMKDETLLLVYPFEESEPYVGGRGSELIGLLRECKANGFVFRNMHPKNLRVSPTGLKLIDYGSDIRPYSDSGYRSMAERAWLTWRWPHRADLEELMRKALSDKSLPELDGFERFWLALNDERPSATRIVSGIVDPIVLESSAKRVLDYGCGKKARSARRLAEAGLQVVGFDPGEGMAAKWSAMGPSPNGLTFTSDRSTALAEGPFDAVICSLVICELGVGAVYEQVLSDLRAAVRDGGVLAITFCNPIATFGGPTSLHRRRDLPERANYEDTFWYTENAETGVGRREFHRPLARIERDLLRHGIRVERRLTNTSVDTERFEPASDFMTLVCRPIPRSQSTRSVSLLIKACAMEAATIVRQVTHLVSQLERPRIFQERVLAIDSRREDFVRPYAEADWNSLESSVEKLIKRGIIDRVIYGPAVGPESRKIQKDWFDIDSEQTHTSKGAPLTMPLFALEKCLGEYILQVDSDILICQRDPEVDYLEEMIAELETHQTAITVSLNVPRDGVNPISTGEGGMPWRVEVRGCLFHKQRLLAARPFPNEVVLGVPQLSWHRSMDQAVAAGRSGSLRGGAALTAFIHPPNEFKRSISDWMLVMDLVEKGQLPLEQIGKVDLVGGPLLWSPRNRAEPYIFVITGRNVPMGRMQRCLDSIVGQKRTDWGAVVFDDGSSELSRESLRLALEPMSDKVTLIQPRERRGQLANMTLAIRHICTNPKSVIITLDLDDALLGTGVIDRIEAEYLDGADVTVGSMLRTDKHIEYPAVLEAPRKARGGNVWQHLRTFRKSLFDAIPDHDLRISNQYVDIAVDWSFMIPIVEMAEKPVWIRDPLYLYEPSGLGKGTERQSRERQIAGIVAKPSRTPRSSARQFDVLTPDQMTESLWGQAGGILFVRHGERPSFAGLNSEQKDAINLTAQGRGAALQLGKSIGRELTIVSSPVIRAVETAVALGLANDIRDPEIRRCDALVDFRVADIEVYDAVKRRLGWAGLMTAWMDGSLPKDILIPCHEVTKAAISGAVLTRELVGHTRVVAVTHDFLIMALLASLRGVRVTAVPYLGGVFVTPDEIQSVFAMEIEQ